MAEALSSLPATPATGVLDWRNGPRMAAPVRWDYRPAWAEATANDLKKYGAVRRKGSMATPVGSSRKKVALGTSAEAPTTASDEMRAIRPGF